MLLPRTLVSLFRSIIRRIASNEVEENQKILRKTRSDGEKPGTGFWQEMDNLLEMFDDLIRWKKVYRFGKLIYITKV